jgi:hypothetical protein
LQGIWGLENLTRLGCTWIAEKADAQDFKAEVQRAVGSMLFTGTWFVEKRLRARDLPEKK